MTSAFDTIKGTLKAYDDFKKKHQNCISNVF